MPQPEILYEDNHILVVVKKAGELTQGDDTGDESLLESCREYIRKKYNKPGNVYTGLVHRLDRPVSGVICFAKTSKAASRLCEQFRKRSTEKIYLAVVEGNMPASGGELAHWLSESSGKVRKTSASFKEQAGAKKAVLSYKVIEKTNSRSLLEIKLLTGYKHQIRVQLAKMGCPIVGDFKYDGRGKGAVTEKLYQGRAIALHASRLIISHPTKKELLTFQAPLPAYWPELTL